MAVGSLPLLLLLLLLAQAMSLKYLAGASRKCPGCGMATIKNEGCNKMTCGYCRAAWCWKCQQVGGRGPGNQLQKWLPADIAADVPGLVAGC